MFILHQLAEWFTMDQIWLNSVYFSMSGSQWCILLTMDFSKCKLMHYSPKIFVPFMSIFDRIPLAYKTSIGFS
jgi:hypothetical protein